MPEVDESAQERETYGSAPGWSGNQRGDTSGATPAPDVEADSSPADVSTAPSAEETAPQEPAPEQAPPSPSQEAPEEEVPFGKHPRWIERQRELEEARRQRDEYRDLAQQAVQRPVQPQVPATPQADPWEGLVNHPDPATAQFYQQQRKLMQHERNQGRQEAMQELQPTLFSLQRGQAQSSLKEFRKENPDIQPGSEDERLIISYMEGQIDGVRHPLESARNNAVVKRLERENQALKSKQAMGPKKREAAKTEASAGIPQTAGLPPRPGDWRDRAGAVIDKGGSFKEVANTIFGP